MDLLMGSQSCSNNLCKPALVMIYVSEATVEIFLNSSFVQILNSFEIVAHSVQIN